MSADPNGGEERQVSRTPSVRVGQWWRDNDKRGYGRTIVVIRIEGDYAYVQGAFGGRRGRIRLNRFRPNSTGYVLVQDAE